MKVAPRAEACYESPTLRQSDDIVTSPPEPPAPDALSIRRAARALVLSPRNDILLMEIAFPRRTIWLTPGGGIEAGETPRAALKRELHEEIDGANLEIGPEVWVRTHTIRLDAGPLRQHERYFVVPVSSEFEPSAVNMPDESETNWFRGFRWWCLDELRNEDRNGDQNEDRDPHQSIAPLGLADWLAPILREDAELPPTPIDISTQPHDYIPD